VPTKLTAALVVLVGVTVYCTLPQPVAGVDAVTEFHVPANALRDTVGADGDVGLVLVELPLPVRFDSTSQPAANVQARSSPAMVDFMIPLS
jgi:hypothetical protein